MKQSEITLMRSENERLTNAVVSDGEQIYGLQRKLRDATTALEQSQLELKNAYLFVNGLQTSLEQFKTTYRSLAGKG